MDLPLALSVTIAIGLACQWLAWKLKLPAILLLLAAGLTVGPASAWAASHGWTHGQWIDPEKLFGPLLLPIVSLSVALILFEGGLTLDARELRQGGGAVLRLVSIGALVSLLLTTLAARYVLGLPIGLATLIGAILVVTGPTVIGPMLRFVRPTGVVSPILRWEGILIDPIGALMAVVVFEAVSGSGALDASAMVLAVSKTVGVGTGMGFAGAGLLMVLLRRGGSPESLHNPLTVAAVLVVFAASNSVQHESGLAAVTVTGMVLANQRRVKIEHVLEFKESLSVLLISTLFVTLSARLTVAQLQSLDWRVVAFLAVMVLLVRPASVLLALYRSTLPMRDRLFISAMAPRGIVAASVASVFSLRLIAEHYPLAEKLVPVTFAVVAGTVLAYGLGSPAVSRRLGLSKPGQSGLLFIGADAVARVIAAAVQREGYEVLLVDNNARHTAAARLAGLPVLHANALSHHVGNAVALSAIGRVLAVTANHEVNTLVAFRHARQFGHDSIYQLADPAAPVKRDDEEDDRHLFALGVTHRRLEQTLSQGGAVKTTRLSAAFDFIKYTQHYGPRALPLFVINERRELTVVTSDTPVLPAAGHTIIALVAGGDTASIDEASIAPAGRVS